MCFEFLLEGSSPFWIIREIEASAKTPLEEMLGPVSPYKGVRVGAKNHVQTVEVEGEPPER